MVPTEADGSDIYQQVFPDLCRFLDGLTTGQGIAADLAQEAFLRYYEKARELRGEDARKWLFRTGRNLALSHLRTRGVRARLHQKLVDFLSRPSKPVDGALRAQQEKQILFQALARIPERPRAALLLRELEQHSYQEIADILEISLASVKFDIYQARLALRERKIPNK